jgi:hypothetical protein
VRLDEGRLRRSPRDDALIDEKKGRVEFTGDREDVETESTKAVKVVDEIEVMGREKETR